MATRPAFYVDKKSETIRAHCPHFEWFPGFSASQKQHSIVAFHKALEPAKALEISTKSSVEFGQRLSAFNLNIFGTPLECLFQGSKVYQFGGPFTELYGYHPKFAKSSPLHSRFGNLIGFNFFGSNWPLEPKTAFYDFIYFKAVKSCFKRDELINLFEYQYFTDIEFNPKTNITCQARAVALIQLTLNKFGTLPEFSQREWLIYHRCVVLC